MEESERVRLINQLEPLVKRENIRSADRAYMRTLLRKLKKLRRGEDLTYQEQQNIMAYFQRYARASEGERAG